MNIYYRLLNACRYGHVSEVDILLSKGANMHYSDVDDPFGATCFSEAARRGKSQIVQLLIDRGISPNEKISHDITALHLACERGHIEVVKVLLSNKCESCPAELFNLDTPLHYAAANDHDKICKILIEEGSVNVNIQNRTGDTPLHIAVANDRSKSVIMLLELKSDLNITNHAEMTPIIVGQLAKCQNSLEAMQPFIELLKKSEENEKKLKEKELAKSRKNTIKKTIDIDNNNNDELKYSEDMFKRSGSEKNSNFERFMCGKRDVVFKKGFLQKQGKKFKTFNERYFILWSNGLLNYYSKQHTVFSNYEESSKKSAQKSSLKPIDDEMADAESGDEADGTPTVSMTKSTKIKKHKQHIKRKSTLAKLGLKSDVIKPKGVIDINDLIETQFLEFGSDHSPGWALITPAREWKFKCKSDRERREWIAAVHAVNYGISPYDFRNLSMNISYKHDTMLLEPSKSSFIKPLNSGGSTAENIESNAVAQGWMYKLGAAVRGLEQNYWKKRWVSLYKKPARLAYAQHPYSINDEPQSLKVKEAKNVNIDGSNDEQQKKQKENNGKESKENEKNSTLSVEKVSKKRKKSNILKGVISLSDVTNIIKIGNNEIIKDKYRAPTVHVFALITDKRTWVFACKTAEECTMWHDRIAFFLPNQWKAESKDVNVEELLRFNRVKTIGHEQDDNKEENGGNDNNHLNVGKKKKDKNDDTVMSKLFRKVSGVAESLGITEQYSTISGVQPKGTITDYEHAIKQIDDEE